MTKPLVTQLASVDIAAMPPMMQHYAQTKQQYPQAILLYRMGDFYETFFEDAEIVSRELELVLTGKEAGKEVGRVAMAGIPYHALERYARQLLEKGYSIAICDQMELAENAKGLVRREVTRVITPGTAIAEEMLTAQQNNYLAAVVAASGMWGLAYADISTGEFAGTQIENMEQLMVELHRLQPAEILIPGEQPKGNLFQPRRQQVLPEPYQVLPSHFCYTVFSQHHFALAEAKQRILETFSSAIARRIWLCPPAVGNSLSGRSTGIPCGNPKTNASPSAQLEYLRHFRLSATRHHHQKKFGSGADGAGWHISWLLALGVGSHRYRHGQ
jgi:DNA mismatch repair protein MutS